MVMMSTALGSGANREQATILVKGEIGHLFTVRSRLHRLWRNRHRREEESPGHRQRAAREEPSLP
jgi:hypothetical protein